MGSVVLHIGTQKTGSTYIQSRFARNRRRLEQHGVIYPLLRFGYDHSQLLTPWIDSGFPRIHFLPHGPSRYFDRVLARHASRPETLFLSCENFFLIGGDSGDLEDFRSRFAAFDDVRLILTVRPQDAFLQSLWMEQCKRGRKRLKADRFIEGAMEERPVTTSRTRLDRVYARWTRVFGEEAVTVQSYDAIRAAPGGPFGAFLAHLCVDAPASAFDDVPRVAANVSPDPLASLVFRELYPRDALDPVCIRKIAQLIKPNASTRTSIYTRSLLERLRAYYAPLNADFARAVRRTQPEFAFDFNPIHPGMVFREDLSSEEWIAIARLAARRRPDTMAKVIAMAAKSKLPHGTQTELRRLKGAARAGKRVFRRRRQNP